MTLVHQHGLELFRRRLSEDRFLAVLVTTRPPVPDPQVSVVNSSVIDHPATGAPVIAFVARRGAKLANLRANPRATLVARAGWEWAAARGAVELSGPDDRHPSFDAGAQRELLRTIYEAAGGRHPDLSEYDQVMLDERRCAVLVHPERIWTNPPSSQHREP
jgi:hypothetical protein